MVGINWEIEEAISKATLFNSREILFDKQTTDYHKIFNIEKNFSPFYKMWTIISDWNIGSN